MITRLLGNPPIPAGLTQTCGYPVPHQQLYQESWWQFTKKSVMQIHQPFSWKSGGILVILQPVTMSQHQLFHIDHLNQANGITVALPHRNWVQNHENSTRFPQKGRDRGRGQRNYPWGDHKILGVDFHCIAGLQNIMVEFHLFRISPSHN